MRVNRVYTGIYSRITTNSYKYATRVYTTLKTLIENICYLNWDIQIYLITLTT